MGRSAEVNYSCDRCGEAIAEGCRTRITTRMEGAHEGHMGEDVGCAFDGTTGPKSKCYKAVPAGIKPIKRREKTEATA